MRELFPFVFSNIPTKIMFYQYRAGHFRAFSGIKMGKMDKIIGNNILDALPLHAKRPNRRHRPRHISLPSGHFVEAPLYVFTEPVLV